VLDVVTQADMLREPGRVGGIITSRFVMPGRRPRMAGETSLADTFFRSTKVSFEASVA
jgi:hypothetical protein